MGLIYGEIESLQFFIRTWIAACRGTHTGKSRVVIPEGTFKAGPVIFQGPCTSKKPIIVEFRGTVLGANDLSLYEEPSWILIEKVDGVIVTGRGTLDGQGSSVWKHVESCSGSNCSPLPPVSFVENSMPCMTTYNILARFLETKSPT